MPKFLLWVSAAVVSIALALLVFFPATWLALILEQQTAGRLTLGDAQGTLWRGSAFIGAAAGKNDPVSPLLPGRIKWRLSPMILLGQTSLSLENPEIMPQGVQLTGSWRNWQVSPGSMLLPADGLTGLGAPLNTVGLAGQMRLVWSTLQIERQDKQLDLHGKMQLELNDMSSRLSFIKPLGAYQLQFDWSGQQAELNLKTVKGPLMLSGTGHLDRGRWQFSGKAQAETGKEEMLANLLSLLGQRRIEGGKNIIALEFKQ